MACPLGCIQSYGEDCQHPCSKHCVNQTCNRFNGNCHFGCKNGYHGQKCEQGIYRWILNRFLLFIFRKSVLPINRIIFNISFFFPRISTKQLLINNIFWFYLLFCHRMHVYNYNCCDIHNTVMFFFMKAKTCTLCEDSFT